MLCSTLSFILTRSWSLLSCHRNFGLRFRSKWWSNSRNVGRNVGFPSNFSHDRSLLLLQPFFKFFLRRCRRRANYNGVGFSHQRCRATMSSNYWRMKITKLSSKYERIEESGEKMEENERKWSKIEFKKEKNEGENWQTVLLHNWAQWWYSFQMIKKKLVFSNTWQ